MPTEKKIYPFPGRDNVSIMNIYTDGSCLGNPGRGGFAFVVVTEEVLTLYGSEANTTNNRMELMAVIKALEIINPRKATIYSDSMYVKNGATVWMVGWKAKGWKKSNGKPILNCDLWIRLDNALKKRDIEFVWVRGHNGDKYNEMADKLAMKGALANP